MAEPISIHSMMDQAAVILQLGTGRVAQFVDVTGPGRGQITLMIKYKQSSANISEMELWLCSNGSELDQGSCIFKVVRRGGTQFLSSLSAGSFMKCQEVGYTLKELVTLWLHGSIAASWILEYQGLNQLTWTLTQNPCFRSGILFNYLSVNGSPNLWTLLSEDPCERSTGSGSQSEEPGRHPLQGISSSPTTVTETPCSLEER